jgi:protocatechuate 3,4-dioxygenase beta subunit
MQIALLFALSQFFFWPSPIDWQMNQQDVALRGAVVDENGGAVANAVVYAMSDAYQARAVSDAKGDFIFLTLFPGVYHLCASKSGAQDDCYARSLEPEHLYAGFEYGATIVMGG